MYNTVYGYFAQAHCVSITLAIEREDNYSFSFLISSGRKSILREAIRRTSDGVSRHAIASAPQ